MNFEDLKSKEFTLGELLSNAWNIYKNHFLTILIITLIIYIPINIILYFIPYDEMLQSSGWNGFRGYLKIVQILETYIGSIATMAIAFVVEESFRKKYVDYKGALKKSFSRLLSFIWANILSGFIILGLMLLFIIPGIIWSGYYLFIAYVVVLRNIGGKEALDYSKSVVKGHWWKIVGINLIFLIAIFILSLAIGYTEGLLTNIKVVSIFTDTIIDIIDAFFTIANIVLFLNLDYYKKCKIDDKLEIPSSNEFIDTDLD